MRFKVLMVDLDGVIRLWETQDGQIEAVHGLPNGAIRQIAFAPDLLSRTITGQISDEEWRERIVERLRREFSSNKAAEAVAQWSQSYGEVDWETISILRRCDPLIQRVLVTNATTRLEPDLSSLGILDEFSFVVNSSAVGVAKPDRRIYEIALRQADAEPRQALFIDDTEKHVRAAEELEISGHIFTTHDRLKDFLRQVGVLPRSSRT